MTVLKISKLQGFEKKKKTTVRKYDVLCGQSRRTASCKELELHNRYDISVRCEYFTNGTLLRLINISVINPILFS